MTEAAAQRLRVGAVVVLFAAWAVAAHWGSAGGGHPDFNVALGLAPIVMVAVLVAWRWRRSALFAVGSIAGLAMLIWAWPRLRDNIPALFYVQHLGTQLALGWLFARTLFGPGEALITQLARRVHRGQLSARYATYTRRVTIAWAIFFAANASVSTLLFGFAPIETWSIYANLLSSPLIGLMFLGEYAARQFALTPDERPSLATTIRAWRTPQDEGQA